jgi:hypothetical protein
MSGIAKIASVAKIVKIGAHRLGSVKILAMWAVMAVRPILNLLFSALLLC